MYLARPNYRSEIAILLIFYVNYFVLFYLFYLLCLLYSFLSPVYYFVFFFPFFALVLFIVCVFSFPCFILFYFIICVYFFFACFRPPLAIRLTLCQHFLPCFVLGRGYSVSQFLLFVIIILFWLKPFVFMLACLLCTRRIFSS